MKYWFFFNVLLAVNILSGCDVVGESAREDIKVCEKIFSNHENREELKITQTTDMDSAEMNQLIEDDLSALVLIHLTLGKDTDLGWPDYKDDIRWVEVAAKYKNIAGGDTEVKDICGVVQQRCYCFSEDV